jgi:hypothetical protein
VKQHTGTQDAEERPQMLYGNRTAYL